MPIAEFDGQDLHFELTGASGLPVIVLSHSLGVTLSMWEPQIYALSKRFQILTYDTRGHGGSSLPDEPCSMAALGQDVLKLCDRLHIARFSFCGLSMGGCVGQWLGIHACPRLDRLILANTAAMIGTKNIWDDRIEAVRRDGIEPIVPGTLERWFTSDYHLRHPEIVGRIASLLRTVNPESYIACCAAIRNSDFREQLSSISVPTLVIAGRHDPVAPVSDAQVLTAGIPNAVLIELDAAHLSNVEAAKDFNESLTAFLVE